MAEESKCCCSKAKKIALCTILAVITASSIASAIFSYQTSSTLNKILNGGSQAKAEPASSKDTITKKYAKNQTMEKAKETGKPIVAFFYADWCTYCKRFAPVFANVVKKAEFKSNLAVAYINCEAPENTELVREYNIQGFPTVYLINPKTNYKEEISNSLLFSDNAEAELLEYFIKNSKK